MGGVGWKNKRYNVNRITSLTCGYTHCPKSVHASYCTPSQVIVHHSYRVIYGTRTMNGQPKQSIHTQMPIKPEINFISPIINRALNKCRFLLLPIMQQYGSNNNNIVFKRNIEMFISPASQHPPPVFIETTCDK